MIHQILLNQNINKKEKEVGRAAKTPERDFVIMRVADSPDEEHKEDFVPSPRIDPVRYDEPYYEIEYYQ